jgi:hypothetical protein
LFVIFVFPFVKLFSSPSDEAALPDVWLRELPGAAAAVKRDLAHLERRADVLHSQQLPNNSQELSLDNRFNTVAER